MLCPVPAHGWGQDAVDVLLDGIVFPHTLFQASVFGVLLAALRSGRDNGQPVFPAQPVADAANLRIAFAVGNVLLMLCKIHSTENDVIMAMLLVDVGSDDILKLAAENFIDKLPPDLVVLCIADLTRLKGLYQMVSEIVAFLYGKQPCFFKLKVCGFLRRSRTRTPAAYRRSLLSRRCNPAGSHIRL